MTTKNDGGPAFGQVVELRCVRVDPFGSEEYEPEVMMHGGLTVRDYFAGKALASGEASNWRDNQFKPRDGFSVIQNTAFAAYEFADAMLAARSAA